MTAFAAFFRFLDTFDELKADDLASHSIYEKDKRFYISIPCSTAAAGPFADRETAFRHLWRMIQRCRNSLEMKLTSCDEPARKRQRQSSSSTLGKAVRYERTTSPVGKAFYANVSHPFKMVTDEHGLPFWVKMTGENSHRAVFAVFAHEDGTRFLVHDNCHDAVTLGRQLTIRCCQQRMG